MKQLSIALYVEGPTDARFLPIIVRRTAEQLLMQASKTPVEVLDPLVLDPRNCQKRADCIEAVAKMAFGYHLLIIHADADARSPQTAYDERFLPGYQQVQQGLQAGQALCPDLMPLIPVRMTEAWMLCDAQALCEVLATPLPASELAIPPNLEADANPKQTLRALIQQASESRNRRRRIQPADLYTPLANRVDLTRLESLPAFQDFQQTLREAFVNLRFIPA